MINTEQDALNFCYFLQGFVELDGRPPSKWAWNSIRGKLGYSTVSESPSAEPVASLILGVGQTLGERINSISSDGTVSVTDKILTVTC